MYINKAKRVHTLKQSFINFTLKLLKALVMFLNVFNRSFLDFSWGFPSLYIPSPVYIWIIYSTTSVCIECNAVESQEGLPLGCLATRVIPIIFPNFFLLGINVSHPQFKSYRNRAWKGPIHLTTVNISKISHFSFRLPKLVAQVMERFTSLLNEVIHLLKSDISDLREGRAGKREVTNSLFLPF